MTATELVHTLTALDVRLAVQGDRLRVDTPRGVITAELRQALIDHKPELLQLLRSATGTPSGDSPRNWAAVGGRGRSNHLRGGLHH